MIYDFPVPVITDTKNIKSVFANPKYVSKTGLAKLDDVVKQRASFKKSLKSLKSFKPDENVPSDIIKEIYTYAENASVMEEIFSTSYKITKNFKWTPMLSSSKILKFSQDIRFGYAGEIIMARFCAFAAQFKQVNKEVDHIRNSVVYVEGESIHADTNFSVIKQTDPVIQKLKESIRTVLRRYTDASISFNFDGQKSSNLFQILSSFNGEFLEAKGISVEIALTLLKINANALKVELCRREANFEEMGKYAKTIVLHTKSLENYLNPFGAQADPRIWQFIQICKNLYKAIALWSLFPGLLAKVKTQSYAKDENMNTCAGACVSFVDEISKLHKSIKDIPNIERSQYYTIVMHYFTKVIVPKASEISKLYGDFFKDSKYDEKYFDKIVNLDQISEQEGDQVK